MNDTFCIVKLEKEPIRGADSHKHCNLCKNLVLELKKHA
jgi:hypothetical protein